MNEYPAELVEQVARALAFANNDIDEEVGLIWVPYREDAIAAIGAVKNYEARRGLVTNY